MLFAEENNPPADSPSEGSDKNDGGESEEEEEAIELYFDALDLENF